MLCSKGLRCIALGSSTQAQGLSILIIYYRLQR